MRLRVNTRAYSTIQIKQLCDFVETFAWHHKSVDVGVTSIGRLQEDFTTGLTKAHKGTIFVTVVMTGTESSYPRISQHVDEVNTPMVWSWDEEFVLVLAHELRHADQMMVGSFNQDEVHAAEVDAERFAVAVLIRYRNSKNLRV